MALRPGASPHLADPRPPQPEAAWALLQQERFGEAAQLAARIIAAEPRNVSAIACRAMAIWRGQGDDAEAIAGMRRAIDLAPAESSLRHNLGILLTSSGDVGGAAQQYLEALRLKPDDTMAFWGYTLNHRFTEPNELVRAMVDLHADPGLDARRREFLAFGLAKAFDDLARPEEAIGYAIEANRLGTRPWDADAEDRALAQRAALADGDAYRRARSSRHPTRAPLFIVGMPRSGTTLLETILSRHPEVLALGESQQLPLALTEAWARGGSGPSRLTRDWLASRAEAMVRAWSAPGRRGFSVVTDKQPDNALQLALLSQLLPRARVIHMRRHPLDTGVSNFFQRFGIGQGFSTRLDWIGRRTRQVADSMAIWKRALDLEILEVSYERLVADPETEVRRVAGFAGLAWVDDFLSPEQSQRSVKTASQWQVRQPINRGSVGRWRRYEPWLGSMIEAMGGFEWIDSYMAERPPPDSAKGGFT